MNTEYKVNSLASVLLRSDAWRHPKLDPLLFDTFLIATAYACTAGLYARITSGFRTEAEQRALVEKGVSWTMASRHLTGHALDVAIIEDGVYLDSTWAKRDYGHFELRRSK